MRRFFMLFFSLDVILQALFSYIWDERGSFGMKKLEQMKNWLTKQIDLPVDVLMDLPRITLVGQVHIYIENHRGLLVFSDKEVRLLLKHGQLLIKGQSFVIKTILPEELLLEGIIEQVTFLEDEQKEK
jgi:sporulation protein YqfC